MPTSSIPSTINVLLVDDDEEDYLIIKRLFAAMKSTRCVLEWASSSDEGIQKIAEARHDAYLVDYRLDVRTGLDVLQEVDAQQRNEPFILLTGMGDEAIERQSLRFAAADYLVKSQLTSDSLSRAIYYALGRKAQEKQKIDQLIELNRSKDEFISIASHQLRTPVTTIKQYLAMVIEGMGGGSLSDQQRSFLQKAYESNERQLAIINNLLKVAQVDSGAMELAQKNTSIRQIVLDAVEDFRPIFKSAQQELLAKDSDDAQGYVDENAIRMIIDNLLENAKKYSESGAKTYVSVVDSLEGVQVSVADEGVGVAHPERLFEKFSRIENKLSTHVGGTGLGLYWAQSIARLHGGDLWYEPREPTGSVFILQLPHVK